MSNDEHVLDGETDDQRQQREQRNADRAQRQAHEEEQQRQLAPHNLDDAFDMVGDQQVFKTPSANVAVAMANLERFSNTPEYQDVRTSIRAHLIAAMGQTADLLRRTQAISYTEVTSNRSRRSQASPRPSEHRRNPSPDAFQQKNNNDHRNREAHHDGRGRDAGCERRAYRPGYDRDQKVDQGEGYDLRRSLPLARTSVIILTNASTTESRTKTSAVSNMVLYTALPG